MAIAFVPASPGLFSLVLSLGIVSGTTALGDTSSPSQAEEGPFLTENAAAMATMMDAMTVKPSGNVNIDFAAMMIPHHQGAIDMALAELRHGRNETLRRIAQEIVVEQQQEIAAMRLALGQRLPPSLASPTQGTPKVLNEHSMKANVAP